LFLFIENSRYDHGSVEEYSTQKGPADYILFHEGKAVACVEGKRVSTGPYNALQQAKRYARGFPLGDQSIGSFGEYRIPFVYSTNGVNIWFQDLRDPLNLSRQVNEFHSPKALKEVLERTNRLPKKGSWKMRYTAAVCGLFRSRLSGP
jgi:type I restriction enzyme R subunit